MATLDLSPEKMRLAVQAAIKLRREQTDKSDAVLRQYRSDAQWVNHAWEWCTIMVPHLIYQRPRVRVSEFGYTDTDTETLQQGLNGLIEQTRPELVLQQIAFDLQFDFGVGLIQLSPTPGLKQPNPEFVPMRPELKRVSPRMYFEDAESPKFGKPRFCGHLEVVTLDELQTKMGEDGQRLYDDDEIAGISGGTIGDVMQDLSLHDSITVDPQRQTVLAHIFIESDKTLRCMAWGQGSAMYLGQPRQYVGVPEGPYMRFGAYIDPDQVYPVAPLTVPKKRVEELMAHQEQASRDAATAKRFGVVSSGSPGVIANLQSCDSGSILGIPGFNGIFQSVEWGGPMAQTLQYIEHAQSQLDRMTGLNNPMRGNITGDATATENALAGQFADVRLKYTQNVFTRDVGETFRRMAWMMDSIESVVFPVIGTDPSGQKFRGTFYGGKDEAASPSPWKRASTVTIEPYSMEYVNQTALRAQMIQAQQWILQLAQAAASGVPVNVQSMTDDLLQTLNIPEAAGRYLLSATQMFAATMARGQQPGTPQAQPQPAMAG